MPTVKELVTSIREYLGNPGHDQLNLATVCLHLYDEINELLNRLNLTDENWLIDRQDISVTSANDEYAMPQSFGRAVTVETVDDGSTLYRRREIQIVHYQDTDLYWNGINNSFIWAGFSHTAEVCSFFKPTNGASIVIKFAPPPQIATTYKVWFEIGYQAPPALAAKPKLMEQFHHLLKVNTAITCLPHCGYKQDEYEQYAAMLAGKAARFTETFEQYIHQGYQEDVGPRRAFGDDRGYW